MSFEQITQVGDDELFSDAEDDWKKARRGVQLVLNNKFSDAVDIFKSRGDSLPLTVGYLYVAFMKAAVTFAEDSIDEAFEVITEIETLCTPGWLQAVKNRVLGQEKKSPYELLEQKIILADSYVCYAFLHWNTQNSTSALVRSGWALRKAWSLYHSAFKELSEQYKKVFGLNAQVPGCSADWRVIASASSSAASSPDTERLFDEGDFGGLDGASGGIRNTLFRLFSPLTTPQIDPDEVRRLMCAVCFGYGLFHLCVSFLPTSILRMLRILGFLGDRQLGIEALSFAKNGPDMRAPLASLALLWYYTIMLPLIEIDNEEICSGICSARSVIEESAEEFSESVIFLFFSGRIYRLKNEIIEAVSVYTRALQLSSQKELSLLCLHEVAWCHFISLDFDRALVDFLQLRDKSRWSVCFYVYLSAVCCGSMNDLKNLATLCHALRRARPRRVTQLEAVIFRRSSTLLPAKNGFYYRLLAYEMLYLWSSLPPKDGLVRIIHDCEMNHPVIRDSLHQPSPNESSNAVETRHNNFTEFEPILGLGQLILGVCYSLVGKTAKAIAALQSVLALRSVVDQYKGRDCHVSAWANYETAVLLIKQDRVRESKELLEKLQNEYTSYDFQDRLELKVHSVLKSIS